MDVIFMYHRKRKEHLMDPTFGYKDLFFWVFWLSLMAFAGITTWRITDGQFLIPRILGTVLAMVFSGVFLVIFLVYLILTGDFLGYSSSLNTTHRAEPL